MLRAVVLSFTLFFTALAAPGLSSAFVVEGPRDGASDAIDNLLRAPRWGLTSGSLTASGGRGLGGGIEYAVDPSVCELRFTDASTCAEVRAAIADALDIWADGHPLISFTDVTDRVGVQVPYGPAAVARQGAEIDFLAQGPGQFPGFRDGRITGYTVFYERPTEGLVLTNGQVLAGQVGQIESADIRINAARCFYIDLARARADCVHLPSLILHEVGHALGLGHPDDRSHLNLDTNLDPDDQLVIDCRSPERGLRASGNIQPAAVLVGQDVQGPGRWKRGLTWDDAAARDALYPHCGIEIPNRDFRAWGAFAISRDYLRQGRSLLRNSAAEAEREAQDACGPDCLVVQSFSACFAFARGRDGAVGVGRAARTDHARVDAALQCSERGRECSVIASFCAFD